MLSRNIWIGCLIVLVAVVLAGQAAEASYTRGHIGPSGYGPNDCSLNPNCVELTNSTTQSFSLDLFGVSSTQLLPYDVIEYSNDTNRFTDSTPLNVIDALSLNSLPIGAGDTLTFNYSGGVPPSLLTSPLFAILDCGGLESGSTTGAIFSSTAGQVVSTKCTFPLNLAFITDETDGPSSISFKIANGITFPSQFAFSFPNGELPTGIDLAAPPVPEPASLSLLAAGLVGLGALRRKRAA